jgi:hypothetical protein
MAAGNYTIGVGSDWYFPIERAVNTSALAPSNPVVEIEITPKPSYPFPVHATLVSGLVMGTSNPVVNAEVEVIDKTIKTITDENGEFVLYFKGIKNEVINIKINKGADTKIVPATVEEGKTVSLGIISFP